MNRNIICFDTTMLDKKGEKSIVNSCIKTSEIREQNSGDCNSVLCLFPTL